MGGTFLEGHLTRVIWSSESSGYAVIRLDTSEGEVTAVGDLAALSTSDEGGPFVTLEGRWETHPQHGRQFRATGYLLGSPRTERGLALYLGSREVQGVGPRLAERIVDHFGLSALTVLSSEPERLREVPGIGEKRARKLAEHWTAGEADRSLIVLLRGLGIPGRLIERIRHRYGGRAGWVVTREPFRLAEEIRGIGFRTADALARRQGLPDDDPARVRAALVHALRLRSGEGHCFLTRAELRRAVAALGVPVDALDEALAATEAAGRVVVEDDDAIWDAALHRSEVAVAWEIHRRLGRSRPVDRSLVDRAARLERVDLDDDQREAVRRALSEGITVITGGPGTGKTTLVRVLVRACRELDERWLLASPTGRAARRLEEAARASASTIHRMLEYRPGEGGFQRDRLAPLRADGLVVDEVSMVDIGLMAALLDALPLECCLVLVGDADQLPSVGPGQVLRDLVRSDEVPVVRLSRIYRQESDSGIVHAAARVNQGEVPDSGEATGVRDFFLVQRDEADRARHTLVTVVAERLADLGFSPTTDVQVLTPMRKGPLGTELLNRVLQDRLNPDGVEVERGGRRFRVGDRVICTRNRYDLEVFNGDVGIVVGAEAKGLVVDFDGRVAGWGWDELPMLDLAYAITVHKAQGSEYPAVVLALHPVHGIMLRRNLLYTAITRARRFMCAIGTRTALARAAARVGGDERNTRLAWRIGQPDTPAQLLGPMLLWDDG